MSGGLPSGRFDGAHDHFHLLSFFVVLHLDMEVLEEARTLREEYYVVMKGKTKR